MRVRLLGIIHHGCADRFTRNRLGRAATVHRIALGTPSTGTRRLRTPARRRVVVVTAARTALFVITAVPLSGMSMLLVVTRRVLATIVIAMRRPMLATLLLPPLLLPPLLLGALLLLAPGFGFAGQFSLGLVQHACVMLCVLQEVLAGHPVAGQLCIA